MRAAFTLALSLGLASAAIGQAPPPTKADAPMTVPFEVLKSRHMAVQVKLNGKGPYRLIFDTGAPMTVINNRIAKDAGILDAKAAKPTLGLFGMKGQQEVKSLEIGGVKLEKAQVVIIDHPTVAMLNEMLGPVDGIVGFPFFARYRMTIDYQKQEMTLVPNGYKPGDYLETLMAKVMSAQEQKGPAVVASAGVWGLVVDKDKADENAGVTVKEVLAGGPAAAAGLKPGDRLLTIDGRWTDTVADTFHAASLAKPGKPVGIVVQRGGKELKLTVTPGKGV